MSSIILSCGLLSWKILLRTSYTIYKVSASIYSSFLSSFYYPTTLRYQRLFFDKMKDTIRDSSFGQLIRLLTRNKLLLYPDETQEFQYPEGYEANLNHYKEDDTQEESYPTSVSASNTDVLNEEKKAGAATPEAEEEDITTGDLESDTRLERHISTHVPTERIASRPIVPKRTSDGIILVDWYTAGTTPHQTPVRPAQTDSSDDPENPQNWSSFKKLLVSFQIWYAKFPIPLRCLTDVSQYLLVCRLLWVFHILARFGRRDGRVSS
jgi:hypothetical protein